jgi:hypothetical protein
MEAKHTRTDDDLLELAARAAGIKPFAILNGHYVMADPMGGWLYGPPVWNPLTDDGDALRLAIKLGADISVRRGHPAHTNPRAEVRVLPNIRIVESCLNDDAAYEAAARLAIVRAAAEIGAKMS